MSLYGEFFGQIAVSENLKTVERLGNNICFHESNQIYYCAIFEFLIQNGKVYDCIFGSESSVVKASCISGAQCKPPRTAMENRSERTAAICSEGSVLWAKATMPQGLGME